MARRGARPPPGEPTLLEAAARRGHLAGPPAPLAERMRPRTLEEVLGQDSLLKSGRLLRDAIERDRVPSLILWGPPGSGKTSLAHVISRLTKTEFVAFSAVLGGVQELRAIIEAARERRSYQGRGTTLFVDEIHRFNRSQQDAFLPHVENGTVTLIGATTENPSFSVNAAVLSRCRVFRLEGLKEGDIVALLERALHDSERGLGERGVQADPQALAAIAKVAGGDARRALGLLEVAVSLLPEDSQLLDPGTVERAGEARSLLYDKSGEEHYNVTSALIKSLRGSDPDAALYWLFRMLDAGDDPLFLLRRLMIFASEDVGNADPRALEVAVNADSAFRRMGLPEGMFPLSHACLYLASCPKSNAVKRAIGAARSAIDEHGALPVPKKLRNAVTRLMKDEGYGQGYQYPPDREGSFVPGETYLPDELVGARFYEPTQQGLEKAIGERLRRLRGEAETEPTATLESEREAKPEPRD
ncbi:MAG TPA: replication-associated recombination protein A [Polyangiaceae bacterium]|nr:replication-associated recombination protein A [Polyangiaceae bacterium]